MMGEKLQHNNEQDMQLVMQEYSVAHISDEFDRVIQDELERNQLLARVRRLPDANPQVARAIMLKAASSALAAHQEYVDYTAEGVYDQGRAQDLRAAAQRYSLIASQIGNEAPSVDPILPGGKGIRRRVSGEDFKTELAVMARDKLLDNDPIVLENFVNDAFPDGIENKTHARFPAFEFLKKQRRKMAVTALSTAAIAAVVAQPAAAAPPASHDDILHDQTPSVSPSEYNTSTSATFIKVLPVESKSAEPLLQSFDLIPSGPVESEPVSTVEEEEIVASFGDIADAAPAAGTTELTPASPREATATPNAGWVELPDLTPPEPAPKPAPKHIPAAPAEVTPPKQEQGNMLKMNERQMEIEAAERLMERGGEWYNIGYTMKYLIERGDNPPAVAAAYTGSFLHEAPGLDPNTHQYGGGPGRGIAQWEGPGRFDHPTEGLLNYANNIVNRPWNDLETQLGFVVWETTNGGYETQMHQIVLDTYRSTGSLALTADAVVDYYERAGWKAYGERRALADKVGLAFDEEYKKVERENNSGGVRVQSSEIVEIEPTSFSSELPVDMPKEIIAAEKMRQQGGEWENIGYAMRHLLENTEISPRLAAAIVGNLSHGDTGHIDSTAAFSMENSALRYNFNAYVRENNLDPNNLDTQLAFIASDLASMKKARVMDFLNHTAKTRGIAETTVAVRQYYVEPAVHEDDERIAKATKIQSEYTKLKRTV